MGWLDGCCGFGGFGNLGAFGWILNLVLTIAFVIGIVLLVVWITRRISISAGWDSKNEGKSPTPREILDSRYARGEIDRDEYLQMIADLS